MTDATLAQLIAQAEQRLKELEAELEPLLAERQRLLRVLEAMHADEPRRRRLSTHERKLQILELLEAKPGLRNHEIAELLGLSEGRITQLVDGLVADSLVLRRNGGIWPTTQAMDL